MSKQAPMDPPPRPAAGLEGLDWLFGMAEFLAPAAPPLSAEKDEGAEPETTRAA